MPAEAMARGFARWSRRVGRGLVRSRGGASATPVVPTPEHPGGGSVDPGTFARGWRARPALGASLRLASTAAGTPVFAGATCERVDVELGTARTRATVGFETGRVARLANGAVVASMGDTVAMCAATTARQPDPDASFFPLSVDYRERASAYGKIPATFTRREGPPKDREVLAMRVVDRALRPLFPKGFRNETSVQVVVLASDQSQDPAVLAVNGASAALGVSDIPFDGPAGAARVAVNDDGDVVANPSDADCEAARFVLTYAGTEDKTLMVEAVAMKPGGVDEATVAAALEAAHEAAREMLEPQRRLAAKAGKEKREARDAREEETAAAVRDAVLSLARERLDALYAEEIQSKSARGKKMAELKDAVFAELVGAMATAGDAGSVGQTVADAVAVARAGAGADADDAAVCAAMKRHLDGAYLHACSRVMRDRIFETGTRVDGRGLDEVRPLAAAATVLPVTHGSSLFERGNTQTLATATIGSLNDVQRLDAPVGPANKRLMLHYAFPSFSIDETPRRGGLSRREIGHGALAEKSLAAALPSAEAWPFAVRLNAETTESNGSSSMAAVCAGSMALMDAGVPIGEHVGAISIGLVTETDADGAVARHALLADIMGLEDVLGDMDFKIAGTRSGITGIQLDCKPAGIPLTILIEALSVAKRARAKVIDEMEAAIPRARRADLGEVPENSPRFHAMDIDVALIGKLIGTGGKTIKEIQSTTGATISVDQPTAGTAGGGGGRVGIFAPNKKALDLAVERVGAIATPLAVGAVIEAVVIDVKPFGWILRTPGLDEGMLHVTEYQWDAARIETSDFLPLGSTVAVKVTENGPGGTKFSRKQTSEPPEGYTAPPARGGGGLPRPRAPLGRGAGQSAGRGLGGNANAGGGFVRNPDGTLKRPLERVKEKSVSEAE